MSDAADSRCLRELDAAVAATRADIVRMVSERVALPSLIGVDRLVRRPPERGGRAPTTILAWPTHLPRALRRCGSGCGAACAA
jgi:hypothetical protein